MDWTAELPFKFREFATERLMASLTMADLDFSWLQTEFAILCFPEEQNGLCGASLRHHHPSISSLDLLAMISYFSAPEGESIDNQRASGAITSKATVAMSRSDSARVDKCAVSHLPSFESPLIRLILFSLL